MVKQYSSEDFNKISSTALLCLEARAKYTDMPYVKEIFEMVKGEIIPSQSNLLEKVAKDSFAKNKISVLELSPLAINEIIEKLNFPVIEFASGLSSRGLEFSGKIPYIETDIGKMISLKEQIVRNIQKRSNHYFRKLNPIDPQEFKLFIENLPRKFKENPVAIIMEGLYMYLSRKEQTQVMNNIAYFFKEYSPKSLWITTDFSARDSYQKNKLVDYSMKEIEKSTQRKFNRFINDKEVHEFLSSGGLKGEFQSNDHLIDKLSCSSKLKISFSQIKNIAHISRPCVIKLKKNI